MIRCLTLILAMTLAGCGGERKTPNPTTAQRITQRIDNAQAVVSKTPEPRTFTINGHQLMVVDVPSVDNLGYIDSQRCYVWRDAEFRTATLSCPALQAPEPDILATSGPTYDNH